MEADLLIAAIALVDRVEQHRHRERQRLLGNRLVPFRKGIVLRGVVDDQGFDIVIRAERLRNPGQDAADRLLCIISDDEDKQTGPRGHVPPSAI